jgi:tRNA (cmo5U34)-methyltransferase
VRALGAGEADIAKAQQRMTYDRCSPVGDQLEWMNEAGLVDVDCIFKEWRFAVLAGKSPV